MDGETLMAPKPKPIPKRFLKLLKGKGRKKGEGLTLTEGLTEGEGLVQTDPNISLKKQKPVKLKLKTTFASHGSKAKPKGVGVALKGYGRAMK